MSSVRNRNSFLGRQNTVEKESSDFSERRECQCAGAGFVAKCDVCIEERNAAGAGEVVSDETKEDRRTWD